jgi:hypothetical protein
MEVAFVLWGLIVALVLTIFLIEIGHWLAYSQTIRHPVIKCFAISIVVGIIVTYLQISSAQGEKGLVAVAIAPLIFLGFAFGGILLGLIYRSRGKPLFVRKPREPVA